jgi:hypothetical protein
VFQSRVFSVQDSILSLHPDQKAIHVGITRGFMKTPGFRPSLPATSKKLTQQHNYCTLSMCKTPKTISHCKQKTNAPPQLYCTLSSKCVFEPKLNQNLFPARTKNWHNISYSTTRKKPTRSEYLQVQRASYKERFKVCRLSSVVRRPSSVPIEFPRKYISYIAAF